MSEVEVHVRRRLLTTSRISSIILGSLRVRYCAEIDVRVFRWRRVPQECKELNHVADPRNGSLWK